MNKITQDLNYRQSILRYAAKYGVTKAAVKYKTNRQYIYRWKKRYDGTLQSLREHSRKPHSHPNQHGPEELKLIKDMRRRNPNVKLVMFWVKLMQRGYTRSVTGLYRVLIRQGEMAVSLPNPKHKPKPYEAMLYPGQRVQIDVKYVPVSCLVNEAQGQKFYQYTAIDEFSRFRFLGAYEENSTCSAAIFLEQMLVAFPFAVECVQTDNGSEFTNRFGSGRPTLFEVCLKKRGIEHKLIRPFTPRHNGKVERSHRKDNEYFYADHTFYSFEDFKKQLAVRSRQYNNFPMRPLKWKSPKQTLHDFLSLGVTYV